MGNIGIWQILIVLLVVLIFFGRGKIPQLMGDVAKGIKSFKKGMSEEEITEAESKTVEHKSEKDKA